MITMGHIYSLCINLTAYDTGETNVRTDNLVFAFMSKYWTISCHNTLFELFMKSVCLLKKWQRLAEPQKWQWKWSLVILQSWGSFWQIGYSVHHMEEVWIFNILLIYMIITWIFTLFILFFISITPWSCPPCVPWDPVCLSLLVFLCWAVHTPRSILYSYFYEHLLVYFLTLCVCCLFENSTPPWLLSPCPCSVLTCLHFPIPHTTYMHYMSVPFLCSLLARLHTFPVVHCRVLPKLSFADSACQPACPTCTTRDR